MHSIDVETCRRRWRGKKPSAHVRLANWIKWHIHIPKNLSASFRWPLMFLLPKRLCLALGYTDNRVWLWKNGDVTHQPNDVVIGRIKIAA